jgi:hypothetical protein
LSGFCIFEANWAVVSAQHRYLKNTLRNLLVNKIPGYIFYRIGTILAVQRIFSGVERVTHFGRVTRRYSVTSLSAFAYLRAILAYFSGQTFAGASRGLVKL